MIIRIATAQDKKQILNLFDEFSSLLGGKGKPSLTSGAIFDELIKKDDMKIFVADDNGTLQGVITFFIIPNITRGWHRGLIEEFFVTKDAQKKGLGTQLLTYVKEYCKTNTIKVIKLHSSNTLTLAHKFYEKNGGKTTERFFRFDID